MISALLFKWVITCKKFLARNGKDGCEAIFLGKWDQEI